MSAPRFAESYLTFHIWKWIYIRKEPCIPLGLFRLGCWKNGAGFSPGVEWLEQFVPLLWLPNCLRDGLAIRFYIVEIAIKVTNETLRN